jgi:DNA replication protein DnaC
MAAHYGTAPLPARPYRPRDKPKVEAAVRIVERWLLGRLRHRRFYSLADEDIDYRAARGLDRGQRASLIKGDWIKAHDNLAITGKTGLGKSWLACALGHKACRDNYSVLYVRAPKLFDELALAHGDGSAGRRLKSLAAVQLLILDDWGLEPLGPQARRPSGLPPIAIIALYE